MRFWELNFQSLYYDEFVTYYLTRASSLKDMWNEISKYESTNPPLYWILERLFSRVTGTESERLRILPAILGTLTLPVIYLHHRVFPAMGRKFGLICMALVAVSFNAIIYSQEARAYSLAIFLSASCSLLWFAIYTLSRRRELFVAYVICAAALTYTHYFGAIFIFVQGLTAYFFRENVSLKKTLLMYSAVFIMFLPWWPYVWTTIHLKHFWVEPPTPALAPYFLFWLVGLSWPLYRLTVFIGLLYICRVGLQIFKTRTWSRETKLPLVLLSWVALPFVTGYIISILVRPMLTTKYLVLTLPAFFILVGWMMVVALPRRHTLFVIVFLAVSLTEFLVVRDNYAVRIRPDMAASARILIRWMRDYDKVFLATDCHYRGDCNFYIEKFKAPFRIKHNVRDMPTYNERAQPFEKGEYNYFAFYVTNSGYDPDLMNYLREHFKVVDHFNHSGELGFLFRRKNP